MILDRVKFQQRNKLVNSQFMIHEDKRSHQKINWCVWTLDI